MNPEQLQAYLHEHIPLSAAMAVQVTAVESDSVALRAPLAPNINHRDTLFGGSAAAIATLAAWSLLHLRLRAEGLAEAQLVIQRNTMDYLHPVAGDFTAHSYLNEPERWSAFLKLLSRRGRARIKVSAELAYDDEVAGRLTGEFVALMP